MVQHSEIHIRLVYVGISARNLTGVIGKIVKKDSNKALLSTEFGEFISETAREIPEPGQESAFAIRAEVVKPILNGADAPENKFTGEVIFVHYRGDAVILHINLPNSDDTFLCELSDEAFVPNQDKIREGEMITVGWSARDSVLLEITGLSYASRDIAAGGY